MIVVPESIRVRIKNYYESSKTASIGPLLRSNPDIEEFLKSVLLENTWIPSIRRAYSCIAQDILDEPKCVVCGKPIDLVKYIDSVRTTCHCSRKCSQSDPIRLEKVKNTSIERYGAENAMQNNAIKQKQIDNMIEKYGVVNSFQLDSVKEKSKKTNLEKYGVEFVSQSAEIKEKSKKTNLEKYGVEFVSQNKSIKEKIKETNIERYGGVAPACSQKVVDKMKKTCLEKYDADCSLKNSEIQEKRNETWSQKYYGVSGNNPLGDPEFRKHVKEIIKERYGADHYMQSPAYRRKEYDRLKARFAGKIEPCFTAEEYRTFCHGEEYKWRCVKCGTEFTSRLYLTFIDKEDNFLPRCPTCHPKLSGESAGELELLSYVKSIYSGEVLSGDRKVLKRNDVHSFPLELDIYIPEKHVAIEFDGLFWHSEKAGKGPEYHLIKTEECLDQGIQLIHVFEDEWRFKNDIVKDRIASTLGLYRNRIYARKCIVKELSSVECDKFLDENHIQGSCVSSCRYGLFHEGVLVAAMTFGRPRFCEGACWELLRFACSLGTSVIGGASKLLSAFRKSHSGSIISYADRRYSVGGLYCRLGFKNTGISKPNYWYVNNFTRLSRYQCQKKRLPELLGGGYDPSLSERDNMLLNGYEVIYDSGNLVFMLE